MSNSLDPDQARRWPDLGPNCLPRLTADVTGRQRVKLQHTMSVNDALCGNLIGVIPTI